MVPRSVHWIAITTVLCAYAAGQTPEERGLAIAQEADQRDTGWGDFTAEMKMTLMNKNGDASARSVRIRVLEQKDDGDKGLTIFDEPKDVQGTAFLSFSHREGDDDQWLYLPALERVKRIASSNQSGPFMGSEFAYEDMTSQEVPKFAYKYLRDEAVGGQPCFVIERYPKHPKSGYTRQIAWIDHEHYRFQKIEYYDRKNELLKTYRASEWEQFLGKYWRSKRMTIENVQTGKSTVLEWTNFAFGTGLTDRDFDQNSLARAR